MELYLLSVVDFVFVGLAVTICFFSRTGQLTDSYRQSPDDKTSHWRHESINDAHQKQ